MICNYRGSLSPKPYIFYMKVEFHLSRIFAEGDSILICQL